MHIHLAVVTHVCTNRLHHLSHSYWHKAIYEIQSVTLHGTAAVKEGCPPLEEVFKALATSNTISDNI